MKHIFFVLILTFKFINGIACTCSGRFHPEFDLEKYESSTHIFTVEVIDLAENELYGQYYKVKVVESFKGNSSQITKIYPDNFSSCSPYSLGIGEQYLFYVQSNEKTLLSIDYDSCTKRGLVLAIYDKYLEQRKRITGIRFRKEIFPEWAFGMNKKYQQQELDVLRELKNLNTGLIEVDFIGAKPDFEKGTVTYNANLLSFKGAFKNGKMEGEWEIYYPISYLDESHVHFLWKTGSYSNGKKVGIWKEYDKNGVLKQVIEYE